MESSNNIYRLTSNDTTLTEGTQDQRLKNSQELESLPKSDNLNRSFIELFWESKLNKLNCQPNEQNNWLHNQQRDQ